MKRKIIIIISVITILIFIIFLNIYFSFLHRYPGHFIEYNFSETDEFKIEEIVTIEKKKNQDFVILNLADIQMCDLEDIFNRNKIHKEIKYLVDLVKPDLITLTGDQTWSNENLISLKALIRWLDELKIPYAPIFGNHDFGNGDNNAVASKYKCCDLYEEGKYSLFNRGPSNLDSIGNYVINIMEEETIYKTLVMMDAGVNDEITLMQEKWFKWNMEGIYNHCGYYPETFVFMHKPLPEYRLAYLNYDDLENDDVYVYYSLSGLDDTGFFNVCKNYNVKNIICGHQHGNCFSLPYQGINLIFALKTGELGGYVEIGDMYLNGATYFVLNDETRVKNIFVPKEKFHINDKHNVYIKSETKRN